MNRAPAKRWDEHYVACRRYRRALIMHKHEIRDAKKRMNRRFRRASRQHQYEEDV